jgi:hypothetical protein
VTVDGEAMGAVELERPEWPNGSIIWRGGDQSNLRVVGRLEPAETPEEFNRLVVEEIV